MPFGFGRRVCVGMRFGMLEVKVALAQLVRRFTFELDPAFVVTPVHAVTLHPDSLSGVHIKLVPRAQD
jgi:cytochrome P450